MTLCKGKESQIVDIRQFWKAHKKINDNLKIKEKIKTEKSEFMFQCPLPDIVIYSII